MIAARQHADEPARTAPRQAERVRTAAQRRVRRTRRRMHKPVFAVLTLAFAVLVPLLAYVTLTANITSLTYAVARADRDRTALADDTQRLDERIVRLQSPDRLAALAAKLKMHDPHVYAVVVLPEPKAEQPRPAGLAFLGGWFGSR
jgi:hypothetical protein